MDLVAWKALRREKEAALELQTEARPTERCLLTTLTVSR